jgi:hypothetical protein
MFTSLKKAIFKLEDISVSQDMSVGELKEAFFGTFGTHIKIYKSLNTGRGAKVAADETVLNELKSETKTFKKLFIKKKSTVGEIENQFKNELGIGIQIMLTNGVNFAPNESIITEVKDIGAREIKDVDGISINGRMKVDTFKQNFKKAFGLCIRVYDGNTFADGKATLASIRKGENAGVEFNPEPDMTIGNVENEIMEMCGIKIQVAGSDDSYLCDKDKTIDAAVEADTAYSATKSINSNKGESGMKINGRMKVKTLKAQFKDEFGLTLRVYDGRSFADDESTLASIRKGDSKGGEFSPRKNTQIGNLENKIMEMFEIKTQIAGSDDSYLCNDDLTLAAALEEDALKMQRKANKAEKAGVGDENSSSSSVSMELNTDDEKLNQIARFIFDKAGVPDKFVEFTSFSVLMDRIISTKANFDEDSDGFEAICYDETAGDHIDKLMNSVKFSVENIYKYATLDTIVSGHLDIDFGGELPTLISKNVQTIMDNLINKLKSLKLTNESSNEDIENAVDYAMGSFFIATNLAVNSGLDDSGEEIIYDWVTAFGNFPNYDNALCELFGDLPEKFGSSLLDYFIEFIQIQYDMDIDDDGFFDDDGQDWEAVAEYIFSTIA